MIWLILMMVDTHDARLVVASQRHYSTEQKCEAGAKHAKRQWLSDNPTAAKQGYTLVTVCTTLDQPQP